MGVGFTIDVSLFPSCPSALYPQQYAALVVVSAQVCAPAATPRISGAPPVTALTVTVIVTCWAGAPVAFAPTTIAYVPAGTRD